MADSQGNPDMMGRLVAAERNALAALGVIKTLSSRASALELKVAALEAENAGLKARMDGLPGHVASMMRGTGPTS